MTTKRRLQNPSRHIAGFTHNPPSEEALHRITNIKQNSMPTVNMLLFTEPNINNQLLLQSLRRHIKIQIYITERSIVIAFNWDEVLIIEQTNKDTNFVLLSSQNQFPYLCSVLRPVARKDSPCLPSGFKGIEPWVTVPPVVRKTS